MRTLTYCAAALAALGAMSGVQPALGQTTQLKPAAERISDEAIQADHRAYEGLQARIKGLNDKGRPVRDYHLAKAQCWLDVSFHEYTRNDRGSFPQAALTESEKLIIGMEQGAKLGFETALVGEAVKLRPDLWARIDKVKKSAGLVCAQHKLACSEIELVHAGNEHAQQQWRHAKPYVQIAEDLLTEAEALTQGCQGLQPEAAEVAPPPPAPVQPKVVVTRELALAAQVVFSFDKHEKQDIRAYSLTQLESLAQRILRDKLEVQSIRLSGHADRLNGTGQSDYNQRLSERRAQTVRELLAAWGVDVRNVSAGAFGDTQQVTACGERYKSAADLQECLLPNRRVEVEIIARHPSKP